MSITLEQLSARMRQGEQVPLRHTAQVALTLSIPSILQQIAIPLLKSKSNFTYCAYSVPNNS